MSGCAETQATNDLENNASDKIDQEPSNINDTSPIGTDSSPVITAKLEPEPHIMTLREQSLKIGNAVGGLPNEQITNNFAGIINRAPGGEVTFKKQLSDDDAVCSFAEHSLFSEEINISNHYLNTPHSAAWNVDIIKRYDSSRYWVQLQNETPNILQFIVGERNTSLQFCTVKPEGGNPNHYNDHLSLFENKRLTCQAEHKIAGDNEHLPLHFPADVLNFFIHDGQIYYTSLKTKLGLAGTRWDPALRVVVFKPELPNGYLISKKPVCIYTETRYAKWESQLIKKRQKDKTQAGIKPQE